VAQWFIKSYHQQAIRIQFTDGIITDHEKKYGELRYEFDFLNKTAK